MKMTLYNRLASFPSMIFLTFLLGPSLAQGQQANYLNLPNQPDFASTSADAVIRLPEVNQDHQALLDTLPDSVIQGAEGARSPVETASYTTLSEVMPIRPVSFQAGNIEVVPYGILWSDMIYTTSRQFPGRFILWIDSEETQGEDAFQLEARYTRVGIKLKGPTVNVWGGLKSGGLVEVDFLGGFLTENQPDTRLRHAFWEAKNDDYRFLVGQYWDLTSPLLPNTANFSVSWGAGNIGFRRAQFRAERYLHLSDNVLLTLQGAIASEVIQDFTSAADISRESPNWPMLQARTALTVGRDGCRPITLGFSGHVGDTGFDFKTGDPANPTLGPEDDARFQTWSFNVDIETPITDKLGFHGEFFTGANLSPLLGGIVQGVCPCRRVPIRSTGGWGEIWYDLTPYLHSHFGFGIDDPNNNDSLLGRTYNRVVYANLFLDVTEHLVTGLEVSSWRTSYHNLTNDPARSPTLPGKATVIDWTVRYKF